MGKIDGRKFTSLFPKIVHEIRPQDVWIVESLFAIRDVL